MINELINKLYLGIECSFKVWAFVLHNYVIYFDFTSNIFSVRKWAGKRREYPITPHDSSIAYKPGEQDLCSHCLCCAACASSSKGASPGWFFIEAFFLADRDVKTNPVVPAKLQTCPQNSDGITTSAVTARQDASPVYPARQCASEILSMRRNASRRNDSRYHPPASLAGHCSFCTTRSFSDYAPHFASDLPQLCQG